ncbi:hypothetical protein SFRURICE_016429 [Spodoptera frugiperda]|nr:hypothetical protein SFRURICE_016429 [Spodoptera frugiperda]
MASLSLPRVLQLKKNSLDAEREQFEKFQFAQYDSLTHFEISISKRARSIWTKNDPPEAGAPVTH